MKRGDRVVTCAGFVELVERSEEEASAAEHILLWLHLLGCSDCRCYQAQLELLMALLAELDGPISPDDQ
jgi:hypothetical protein